MNSDGTAGARANWGDPTLDDPSVSSTTMIDDGEWHHLVTVTRVNEVQLWVDGVLAGRTIHPGWAHDYCSTEQAEWSVNSGFVADFDEFASYGHALEPQQIQDHYVASGRQPALTLSEMFGPNPALRNQAYCQACEGDPVDVYSGNLHMPVPGVSVSGRGAGLRFELAYNSLASAEDSKVGFGWSSTLDMRLVDSGGGAVKTVVQETGATVPFTAAGSGWEAPERFVATLEVVGAGLVFTRNHFEKFRFDSLGRLDGIGDQFGNWTTVHYPTGTSTEADYMQEPGGTGARQLVFEWESGRLTEVTEPAVAGQSARKAVLSYTDGDLVGYQQVLGGTWNFGYTGHRMEWMRKPRHSGEQKVVNHYDAKGRVDWQEDELDRRTTFAYDTPALDETLVTFADPDGTGPLTSRKRLHHFEGGLRTETIDGYGTADEVSARVEVDPVTRALVSTEDGAGNVTTFADVDGDGNVDAVTDPTGKITRFTYNSFDQVTEVAAGETTTDTTKTVVNKNEYDPLNGRLEKILLDEGPGRTNEVTDLVYGTPGYPEDLTSVIDPRSKTWSFTSDPLTGYQLTGQDPLGNITSTTYNELGWPVTVTAPEGVASSVDPDDFQTTYAYNLASRTTTVTGPKTIDNPAGEVSRTVLDANGNTSSGATGITASKPAGDITSYTYNDADQLVTLDPPGSGSKTYRYRGDGLVDRFTNELSSSWNYGYDAAGRISTESDPLAKVTAYTYDTAGRLATTRQPVAGATCTGTKVGCITYAYDAAGRPTGVDYSDPAMRDIVGAGSATDFANGITYDTFGRRLTMRSGPTSPATTAAFVEEWTWDALSRVTSNTDANGRTTSYGWDEAGNLETIRYPGQSSDVVNGYDDAGRLTTVKDWIGRTTTFAYDANSNWITTSFPKDGGGTANTDRLAYDAAGRMTSAAWYAGTNNAPTAPLGSESYTRPATTKAMVAATTKGGAAGTTALANGYDTRDRLTSTGAETFGYDDAGNLTTVTAGTVDRLQVFNPAQQLCWTSVTATTGSCGSAPGDATNYAYDDKGNRLTATTQDNALRTHTYDQANRLTEVTDGTGTSAAPLTSMSGQALVGNFDGDTEDDVFFYRPGGSSDDWVWWGTKRAQFGSATGQFSVSGTYTPVTGDFNCDGNDDIFWYAPGATTNNDPVWFWFGRHDTATTQDYDSKFFNATGTYTPVVGDFDADGCSDLFWYAPGTAGDVLWWGDEDVADTGTAFDLGLDAVNGTDLKPVVGNFNGSGGDDIFWHGPGSSADTLWLWTTSRTHTNHAFTISGANYTPSAGDVDGDGKDDLLFYDPSGADVIWWGNTISNFGSANSQSVTIGTGHTPVFGDFDGDGKDDLFLYKPAATGDTIWWGNTKTTFGTTGGGIGFPTGPTMTADYRYGGNGLRAGKTVNSGTEQQYTWSSAGGLPLLLGEHQGTASTWILYGPGGQPFEQLDNAGAATWLHHDQLGSVRYTTNATAGAETSKRSFDAYGNSTTQTGNQPLFGYAGQYTDTETGYHYLRARYYDPATGQFLTVDPAVAITLEPYGYVYGNPVNSSDPSGLGCGITSPGDCVKAAVDVTIGVATNGAYNCIDFEVAVGGDNSGCTTKKEANPEAAQAAANYTGGLLDGVTGGNGREILHRVNQSGKVDYYSPAAVGGAALGSLFKNLMSSGNPAIAAFNAAAGGYATMSSCQSSTLDCLANMSLTAMGEIGAAAGFGLTWSCALDMVGYIIGGASDEP